MPYKDVKHLPEPIRKHLPAHAQKIYLSAFNNAWEQYDSEESAHRVAWSAVKTKYEKGKGDKWVPKKR